MVLIYNRKYDILLQKKQRGRETKVEDDLEEQTSLKTWGDLEIWGVMLYWYMRLRGLGSPNRSPNLFGPQNCGWIPSLNSFVLENQWLEDEISFWDGVFSGVMLPFTWQPNNHGVTSCDLDLDEVQGVLIMVEVSQSQRPCVTGSCNWQQVSSPQSRNIKKLVPKLYILSILL